MHLKIVSITFLCYSNFFLSPLKINNMSWNVVYNNEDLTVDSVEIELENATDLNLFLFNYYIEELDILNFKKHNWSEELHCININLVFLLTLMEIIPAPYLHLTNLCYII